ncbi:MAG TPA: hypothetical protein VN776_12810 [Terracidiphilus sp.]|nr:hypothetical protein [Terracidiphilus sp.]
MYGDLIQIGRSGKIERARHVSIGELKGKNEAWLRDTLFGNPELIPTEEIDPAFGPLIPLCVELRTGAGSIDAVFVNRDGRLTILECKLWKNPQSRREVVAQALDYVSTISSWSYTDLQRNVSAALRRQGNLPFEIASKSAGKKVREEDFVDSASRSLREGRILVLIAGDGIREGVQSLTDLVNRSATLAFSFALIEVALYCFPDNRLVVQPRVLAKTKLIERFTNTITMNRASQATSEGNMDQETSQGKGNLKAWWKPVLQMKFDDPEQERPFWTATNNVVLNTPFPGIQIKAYAMKKGSQIGVFLSGPKADNLLMIKKYLKRDYEDLEKALPQKTTVSPNDPNILLSTSSCDSDEKKYAWIKKTLNGFVNALSPYLRRWYEEYHG